MSTLWMFLHACLVKKFVNDLMTEVFDDGSGSMLLLLFFG